MSTADALLFANGVDATTGGHLLAPMTVAELARRATTGSPDRAGATELAARHLRATERIYAPKQGVDPADLAQTGWGIVFAQDTDPRVVAALTPLLERRHAQAGAVVEGRYREFAGGNGYRRGESKQEFLRRHRAGPGPVDPDVIPYYLLLVGGPDEIPFEFQYQLDIQHAVGRIHFDDVAGHAHYAANVVAAETRPTQTDRPRLSFFAAHNDDDPATTLSSEHLVTPLAAALGQDTWRIRSFIGPDATKDGLRALLSGGERPDVLFTATHGIGFPAGHADQRRTQGALVCQDCFATALQDALIAQAGPELALTVSDPYSLDVSTEAERTEGHAIQLDFEPDTVFVDVVAIEEGPTLLYGSFVHTGNLTLEDEGEILAPVVERLKEL